MGRYYNGDIEGKFWFGVQSSRDAEFFGGEGHQPEEINYWFTKESLSVIRQGIKTCKKKLGKNNKRLNTFFDLNLMYNDEKLKEYWLSNHKEDIDIRRDLEWYARLSLGEQILECVEKQGDCSFTAEL
tara:strand:- start:561 stop:944 length:384 start_codon:yes stop_codon:yes gene_type:complete